MNKSLWMSDSHRVRQGGGAGCVFLTGISCLLCPIPSGGDPARSALGVSSGLCTHISFPEKPDVGRKKVKWKKPHLVSLRMYLGSDLHPGCTVDYLDKISVMKGKDCEFSGCFWGICQNSCLTFALLNPGVPLERGCKSQEHSWRVFRHLRMQIMPHWDF